MKKIIGQRILRAGAILLALVLFAACSEGAAGGKYFQLTGKPKPAQPDYIRTPPPFRSSGYSGAVQQARDDGDGRSGVIDLSNLSNGYVAAKSTSGVRTKFAVECNGESYNYDLNNQGRPEVFPLSKGDGHYVFTIFLNKEGDHYEYYLTAEADVKLENEFLPFLVPNQIVNYTQQSETVRLSYELAQNSSSNLEVVQEIYYWIETNISYDTDKAGEVLGKSGYLPNVDEILQQKKGICYDYAAVAATMMRANGIPCKLIMGNVRLPEDDNDGTQDVYHAWNMIWLEETGWIAVKMPSSPGEWQRIDTTFAAGGDSGIGEFIGNGKNYFDISAH